MNPKRLSFSVFFVFGCSCASGQSTGDSWQHVRRLPVGKTFYVQTETRREKCSLVSIDDIQLTCNRGKKNSFTFSLAEIKSIKLARTGDYTAIGLLVGAGVGAGVGALVERPGSSQPCNASAGVPNFCGLDFSGLDEGLGALTGGLIGAVVGTPVGFWIDSRKASTIYRAP